MSTTTETKFKIECEPENARTFYGWIISRGGVAKWRSVNLSNPGASWSTPANDKDGKPCGQPTWQAGSEPEIIVTNPKEIGVYVPKLHKAFRVGLRRSSSGFSTKLTDGAQRRLDTTMAICRSKHGDAFYKKGVLDIDGASMGVYFTESIQPLDEWISKNGVGDPEDWDE